MSFPAHLYITHFINYKIITIATVLVEGVPSLILCKRNLIWLIDKDEILFENIPAN